MRFSILLPVPARPCFAQNRAATLHRQGALFPDGDQDVPGAAPRHASVRA